MTIAERQLREKCEQLIRSIPTSDLKSVVNFLEFLINQKRNVQAFEDFLDNSPDEDEEISEDEELAVAEAMDDLKARRFRTLDEVMKDFEA